MWPFTKKQYISSNLKLEDTLPVGTIVELNDYEGKYMIQGYKGFNRSKNDKKLYYEVDYWCMRYVLGTTTRDFEILPIMSSEIKQVIFKGYNSKERIEFLKEIDFMKGEKDE